MNDMKLTFGKFNGWNLSDLARTTAGRRYLVWAADGLRSPKWRDACSAALRSVPTNEVDADINLSARAIQANDPHDFVDIYEARDCAIADREDAERHEAEAAAFYARQAAVYAEFADRLQAAGVSIADAKKAVAMVNRQYERPDEVPAARFSTPARRDLIVAIANRLEETDAREW